MAHTYTRETADPIKVTVSVSIEIAGLTDEMAESVQEVLADVLK